MIETEPLPVDGDGDGTKEKLNMLLTYHGKVIQIKQSVTSTKKIINSLFHGTVSATGIHLGTICFSNKIFNATTEEHKDYATFEQETYILSSWHGKKAQGANINNRAIVINVHPKYKEDLDWIKIKGFRKWFRLLAV
ncbi:glycoside hydrolase family 48 protein [Piromyces sp. E2]|nr:glycoside hydrolase family 48 protein [Piromyces sp. E2]|eukprot:OUM59796.1 glycoside hydrolase family 48 protein [Piromyces sp. E2]